MKEKILFVICLLVALFAAAGDVQLTLDTDTVTAGTSERLYGINISRGVTSPVATNQDYQDRFNEINPSLIRFNSSSIGRSKWIDANEEWDVTEISQVLNSALISGRTPVITIHSWPNRMDSDSDGKLDSDKYDDFADFCAELVEIVNDQLGLNITYWEPTNEKNSSYTTDADARELAHIFYACVQAMKAQDSSIKIVGAAWSFGTDYRIRYFLDELATLDPGYTSLDYWSHHTYTSGSTQTDVQVVYDNAYKVAYGINRLRGYLDMYGYSTTSIWVDEYNILYSWDTPGIENMTNHVGVVHDALVMKEVAEQKLCNGLFTWTCSEGAFGKIASDYQSLNPGGIFYKLMQQYGSGKVMATTSNNDMVKAFAVQYSENQIMYLVINRDTTSHTIDLQNSLWTPYHLYSINSSGFSSSDVSAISSLEIAEDSVTMFLGEYNSPLTEVVNGDFESGDSNWSGFGSSLVTVTTDAANVNSGSGAAAFQYASSSWPGITQEIKALPNADYQIACFWKADNAPKNGTIRVIMYDNTGKSLKTIYKCNAAAGTYDYQQVTGSFTTPDSTAYMIVKAYINNGSGGMMYLDDLRVDLISQLIPNNSFETGLNPWSLSYSSLVSHSSETAADGEYSVKLTYSANSWPGVIRSVAVEEGKSYEFSCWWKGESVPANGTMRLEWRDENSTKIGSTIYICSSPIGTFDFTEKTAIYTAPAGAVTAAIKCYINAGSTGIMYLDNIKCEEVE